MRVHLKLHRYVVYLKIFSVIAIGLTGSFLFSVRYTQAFSTGPELISMDVPAATLAGPEKIGHQPDLPQGIMVDQSTLSRFNLTGSAVITISKKPAVQQVRAGDLVDFMITITNTDGVTLTNVVIEDRFSGDCNQALGADLLDGEAFSYACTTAGSAIDFTNVATVTGTLTTSGSVTASDTAFVDVINPGIVVGKTPKSQTVLIDSNVTFTVSLTNTGDVDLQNIIPDDPLCALTNPAGDFGTPGVLEVDEIWTYDCQVNNVASDFINTATITATPPVGDDVVDSDTASVTVIDPMIEITKLPANSIVLPGADVLFTVYITNTGDVPVTGIVVTESDAKAASCARSVGDLSAMQSITPYTCTATNITAGFDSTATATGSLPLGTDVVDTATVSVDVAQVLIAKTPITQVIDSGDPANFTILVTNQSDVTLTDISVSDPNSPDCDRSIGQIPNLIAGQSHNYNCAEPNVTDGFINTATATGNVSPETTVSDTDSAGVILTEAINSCPAGTLAHWKLDETVTGLYDDFYNGHDGECAGLCPTPLPGGQIDGAQTFNGSDPGLDIPIPGGDETFAWSEDDSFSIEIWMQSEPGTCSTEEEMMIGRRMGGDMRWWLSCLPGNGLARFKLSRSGQNYNLTSSEPITDGLWHHIVGIREASGTNGEGVNRLYIDGVEVDAQPRSYDGGFAMPSTPINLGWIGGGFSRFQGSLDEATIYGRALPTQEVQQHYLEGQTGHGVCDPSPFPPDIYSTPVTEAAVQTLYNYDVDAVGDPALISYSAPLSPTGMTINPTTGLIAWTPLVAQVGVHTVTVEASNTEGTDSQTFEINVAQGLICLPDTTAYWHLDETTPGTYSDFFGGLEGTCVGACPVPEANGQVNGAQTFNGTDTGLEVANNDAFNWGQSDSFSIEFWTQGVNGVSCSVSNEVIVGLNEGSPAQDLHWWVGCDNDGLGAGQARFELRDTTGDGPSSVIGGPSIVDGNWHHVVAVRDGTGNLNRLYVDGLAGQQTQIIINSLLGTENTPRLTTSRLARE